MNQTLTTSQLRLVALVLAVVVVGGGYWVVAMHKSSSPSTASSTPVSTTPTPSKTHTHTPAPSTKLATHGLPSSVARALRKHSVVVVSLSSPRAGLDKLAAAEAKAGAAATKAGYVVVNVFHQRSGIALLRKLGVVDTPAVLVIKRPGRVMAELKGFVDRNVVVQAVTDAR
jgi:hypothetical protein